MRSLAVLSLLVVLSSSAMSWDGNGHQLVAVIAERQLTKWASAGDPRAIRALAKFQADLNACPVTYRLGGIGATYPDDLKDTTTAYNKYHYSNVAISRYGQPWKPVGDSVGIVKAIALCESVLRQAPMAEAPWGNDRSQNLMFLLHFTGDIHQPLHLADNGDQGGNATFLDFSAQGGPRQQKLHSYWDGVATRRFSGRSTPLSMRLEPKPGPNKKSDPSRVIALADHLVSLYPPNLTEAQNMDVETWAEGSFMEGHDTGYTMDLSSGRPVTQQKNGQTIRVGTVYVAPANYEMNCEKSGLARIVLGGFRLAYQLKSIYGG